MANVMGNPTQRYILREPVGVFGGITPWNVPNDINLKKLGWAMAAGCTVVLKAAPTTSWCANFLAEVIATKTDVPAGAFRWPARRTRRSRRSSPNSVGGC